MRGRGSLLPVTTATPSSSSFSNSFFGTKGKLSRNRWRTFWIVLVVIASLWVLFSLFGQNLAFQRDQNNKRFQMELEQAGILKSEEITLDAIQEGEKPLFPFDKDSFPPSKNAHVFYYPWYGNPETNGQYLHWDHEILPNPYQKGPQGEKVRYQPPDQVGANFYPKLGPYSSTNRTLIHHHMKMIRDAGVGVITVSWYPASYSDGQIESNPGFSDATMVSLLEVADLYGIKVNLHVEPYKGRNEVTLVADIKYCIEKYSKYPAFYRHPVSNLPMFYLYDSYLTPYANWAKVLKPGGPQSIRGTDHDAIVIALLVESHDLQQIPTGGFDGVYTYFATDGFTYGSSIRNWQHIAQWAKDNSLIFIPSIGPGYIDTRIRPWNAQNARSREEGKYYDRMFNAALSLGDTRSKSGSSLLPEMISITSWNEWHEGTQIEPAIPKTVRDGGGVYKYEDYSPHAENYYLERTLYWVQRYHDKIRT